MGQQAAVISCCLLLPPVGTLPYCSSPDYTYYYSDDYIYEAPECRAMALEQIVKKLDGVVYIITQFQERFEVGWPCSQYKDDDCNSSLFDAAHTGQPTLIKRAGGQCVCLSGCVRSPSLTAPSVLLSARSSPPTSLPPFNCLPASRPPGLRTKTIFPVGVENLAVKFEHTFKTKQTFSDVWTGNTGLGVGKTLRGSSSSKPCSLVTVTPPQPTCTSNFCIPRCTAPTPLCPTHSIDLVAASAALCLMPVPRPLCLASCRRKTKPATPTRALPRQSCR